MPIHRLICRSRYVTGCIFWENFANKSKHFVSSCVTQPCGINACGGFAAVGEYVTTLADGADFSCVLLEPNRIRSMLDTIRE